MRASRLLSLQMLLETRGRMSARALAQELQVSVRTLHRDVDQLSAAGVPIYADRGRHGGFALLPGWRTTLTGLTPAEAQAVFLSGLPGPAADLGLAGDVASAQLKLLAALPAAWRGAAQSVSGRLHLDPIAWYRDGEATPHLATVAAGVWQERQLAMRYASWSGTAERTVAPLGLVLKAGLWYLVALSDGGALRTYRISAIQSAALTDLPVPRPPGFDLPAHWARSLRAFEERLHTGHADVLATERGLARLEDLTSAIARAVRQAREQPSRRRDGRVAVRLLIESIAHACGQLLPLAPDVEVVRPAALRRAVVQRLRTALEGYGGA